MNPLLWLRNRPKHIKYYILSAVLLGAWDASIYIPSSFRFLAALSAIASMIVAFKGLTEEFVSKQLVKRLE